MKCKHCGKNEATFYYKSNINGQVTEQHLCGECARELGYAGSIEEEFSRFGEMQREMFHSFDDLFLPMPALMGSIASPFERMFGGFDRMLPQLNTGTASQESQCAAPAEHAPVQSQNDLVSEEEHKALDCQRRVNALRHEMEQAVRMENFERAAQLRDEIHAIENAR